MIEVETPAGIVEFPDGTPPDTIKAALRKRFPPAAAPAAQPAAAAAETGGERPGWLESVVRAARQGLSFGFADELDASAAGVGNAITGRGPTYDQQLEQDRAAIAAGREAYPIATMVGEMGGAMLVPGGAGVRATTMMGKAAVGALTGALTGGAYGFGSGEGGLEARLDGMGAGALIGGAVGAAAPYVARGVQQAVDGRRAGAAAKAAASAAPSVDDLRTQASALYDAAAARGVRVKPQVAQAFADDVASTAATEGLDPILTPRSSRAVERIQEMAASGKVAWKDIELARRVTGIAAQSNDPAERRMAGIVSGKIDDFLMNLVDGDLDAGTAQGLSKELVDARALWKRMRGSERIESAMTAAKDAASGYENGLRIEFRKLIKDQKFFRSLSGEEQRAIRQVVQGTTTGNILRRLGRLSFGHGAQTNMLGASVGAGIGGSAGAALGTMVGGPIGGVVGAAAGGALTGGAGHLAAKGAERATQRGADLARGLVAAGGLPAQVAPANLMLLENALSRASLPAATVGVNALATPLPR